MATPRQIRQVVEQIARQFSPDRVILFGSHAYGGPSPDSDVDLLIVMPCRWTLDKEFEIRQALHAPFPLDVLVRTPQEIARRLAWNDFFLREITTRGKLLYEAIDSGMGEKGRGGFSKRATRAPRPKAPKSRRGLLPRTAVRSDRGPSVLS